VVNAIASERTIERITLGNSGIVPLWFFGWEREYRAERFD